MEQTLRSSIICIFCFGLSGPPAVAQVALDDAARDLGRRLAARLGPLDRVVLASRALSPAPAADRDQAERAIRRVLPPPQAPGGQTAEVRLTVTQARTRRLLVAELRRGDESAVLLAEYEPPRKDPGPAPALQLEKRLIWEQAARVLDVAFSSGRLLVLDVEALTLLESGYTGWVVRQRFPLPPGEPMPRDPRGRIAAAPDGAFRAWFPGGNCSGQASPWRVECTPAASLWPVAEDLEAEPVAGGNHFASPRAGGLFFSAARAAGSGSLVVAGVDGRTRLVDAAGARETGLRLGTDMASIANPCSGGGVLFVAASGDGSGGGSLAAHELTGPTPRAAGATVETGGTVTALWTAGDGSVVLVVRGPDGRYAAYRVSAVCGG